MMINININSFVTVKLTKTGRERLEKFHKRYNPNYNISTFVEEDGTYNVQLHQLLLEFGGTMFPAFESPFDKCNIAIEDTKVYYGDLYETDKDL